MIPPLHGVPLPRKALLSTAVALAAAFSCNTASATVALYDFTYTYVHGAHTHTLNAVLELTSTVTPGQFLATNMTGTFDGGAVTLTAPGGFGGNDNLVNPTNFLATGAIFTGNGLSFGYVGCATLPSSCGVNIYGGSNRLTQFLSGDTPSPVISPLTGVSLTAQPVAPVALPGTLSLLLGGLGLAGWSRRRASKD